MRLYLHFLKLFHATSRGRYWTLQQISVLYDHPLSLPTLYIDHRWKGHFIKSLWRSIGLLYIDLRPRQTCHSKDGRSAYSIGVGELGWQYGTGLKSHGTVTNWCTGREWPVNCMTVISAWWRSNMPFQRRRKWHISMASYGKILSGRELLYNWVHRKFNQFWRSENLEKRCGRESQHPVESWAPGLRLSSPGKQERNADGHKSGEVNMLQFCSVSNSLSHTPLSNKVRGIFFEELCLRSLLLCCRYDFACICIWVCNRLTTSGYIKIILQHTHTHKDNMG